MHPRTSWFLATVVAAALALTACSKGDSTDVANGAAGTIMAAKRAITTAAETAAPAAGTAEAAKSDAAAEVARAAVGGTALEAADAAEAASGSGKNSNRGAVHNNW